MDHISQLYQVNAAQPVKPVQKTDKPEKKAESSSAARLIPDMQDKVEFSPEGLEAASKFTPDGDERVPKETAGEISHNWYSVGLKVAYSELDKA